MSDDGSMSFSLSMDDLMKEPPAEIDVRGTYGDLSIDDFAKQHAIGYLGLPFQWDEDDQGWSIEVKIEHIKLMGRFVDDLNAMGYDNLETGEHDGEEDLGDGVVALFAFRAAQDE